MDDLEVFELARAAEDAASDDDFGHDDDDFCDDDGPADCACDCGCPCEVNRLNERCPMCEEACGPYGRSW